MSCRFREREYRTKYVYNGAKRRVVKKTYSNGTLDERLFALQDVKMS